MESVSALQTRRFSKFDLMSAEHEMCSHFIKHSKPEIKNTDQAMSAGNLKWNTIIKS